MALPATVRVKLSSEAAESISLTPVVVQEIPVRELIEHMLGITGKDEPRIRDLLLRGSLVAGASRFRWQGWAADPEGLREVLASFPDPDPARAFAAERCVRAILRGGRQPIELRREAVARKGLFRRETFWDLLMEVVGPAAAYAGYSYRERADRFLREFSLSETERLRGGSGAIPYSTLKDQIRSVAFTQAELYVTR
ncbi:conserved hypothetical protein [Candidatus Sulfopaludibacter sp. SbA4]|nr:conserved hypothetical protein [Candidatus Sulfopaludibacter sp. SbA4]